MRTGGLGVPRAEFRGVLLFSVAPPQKAQDTSWRTRRYPECSLGRYEGWELAEVTPMRAVKIVKRELAKERRWYCERGGFEAASACRYQPSRLRRKRRDVARGLAEQAAPQEKEGFA